MKLITFSVTVSYVGGGEFHDKVRACNKAAAMLEGEKLARRYDSKTAKIKGVKAVPEKEKVLAIDDPFGDPADDLGCGA